MGCLLGELGLARAEKPAPAATRAVKLPGSSAPSRTKRIQVLHFLQEIQALKAFLDRSAPITYSPKQKSTGPETGRGGSREGPSRDKLAHLNPSSYLLGFKGGVEAHSAPNVQQGDSDCTKCGVHSKQGALFVSTPSWLSMPNP